MMLKILPFALFLSSAFLVEKVNALSAKDCLMNFVDYENWSASAKGSNFFEPETLGLGSINLILEDNKSQIKKAKKDTYLNEYGFFKSTGLSFSRFSAPERPDVRFYQRYIDYIYDEVDTFIIFSGSQKLGLRISEFCGIKESEG